jgi:ammonium transporter, Amt family
MLKLLSPLALLPIISSPAFAQAAAAVVAPKANPGDTAWMLIATALVLLMSIPGLALFYGGMVRAKNILSVLTQTFVIVAVISILWTFYGYSFAFSNGGALNDFIGGTSKLFLKGIDVNSTVPTFSNGVVIPEYVYVAFQMTFACIAPALIIGAFAERVKFSSLLIFSVLWFTFVYLPIAHMVWYWAGPDAIADAVKAVAAAGKDVAKKATAEAALAAVKADAGLLFQWGALDFAGGTVIHINAGIAGLVGAFVIGPRIGFKKELLAPHSLPLTMIGASLLWFGWFGFNAGSNLEANGTAALAFLNTFVAASAATLGWCAIEWIVKGKPSLLGAVSGAVAGLVAVTPAAGLAGPVGSIVLGFIAAIICFFFCTTVKNKLNYDDSLDAFGVHAVGGIVGALATGILVSQGFGGVGIPDYETKPGELVAGAYELLPALIVQAKAVGVTILWTGIGSYIIFKILDLTMGLRVSKDEEREGLDLASHGERAYHS